MKISLDLDDTLCDSANNFAKFLSEKYPSLDKINLEKLNDYHIDEFLGISKEELYELFKEFNDWYLKNSPNILGNAREVINELSKRHELIIITARPSRIREETANWIKQNFPEIKEVHFIREKEGEVGIPKAVLCKKLGVDVHVDDSIEHLVDCLNHNIIPFLLDSPWNKEKDILEGIKRLPKIDNLIKEIREFE